MRKVILASAIICIMASPTLANHPKQEGCEPYYHNTKENSIGSKIADTFFLRFTASMEAVVYGINKAIGEEGKHPPFCMTKALGKHLIEKPVIRKNWN